MPGRYHTDRQPSATAPGRGLPSGLPWHLHGVSAEDVARIIAQQEDGP